MLRAAEISIHAPHTRSDKEGVTIKLADRIFQSTPLIRGATCGGLQKSGRSGYFNPRPSYEERRHDTVYIAPAEDFNPRPSYEERRGSLLTTECIIWNFNPRPSYEERRYLALLLRGCNDISIHAPHTRSDCDCGREKEFNKSFQSTPLIRGATIIHERQDVFIRISIHAPHTRSDSHTFTPSFF